MHHAEDSMGSPPAQQRPGRSILLSTARMSCQRLIYKEMHGNSVYTQYECVRVKAHPYDFTPLDFSIWEVLGHHAWWPEVAAPSGSSDLALGILFSEIGKNVAAI